MSSAYAAARRRHPCTRCPVPPALVHQRVVAELELAGSAHPEVAAAILSVRGASGLGPEAFARRCGIDAGVLDRAEAGELARDQLPGPLRRIVPR